MLIAADETHKISKPRFEAITEDEEEEETAAESAAETAAETEPTSQGPSQGMSLPTDLVVRDNDGFKQPPPFKVNVRKPELAVLTLPTARSS
jgi:hypothetical protein